MLCFCFSIGSVHILAEDDVFFLNERDKNTSENFVVPEAEMIETITENQTVGTANALQAEALPNQCGDNVSYLLLLGTLYIHGTGDMWEWTGKVDSRAPWFGKNVSKVVIENGVTSIGDWAFSACINLTSVTIPNSVTTIGEKAFACCEKLTSITIPDSVTSIGNGAFILCSALTSITIPGSVTSIGNEAFGGCYSLSSISIPSSVTKIGKLSFYDCDSLTNINIPGNGSTSIGANAFEGCENLQKATIGSGVISLGANTFIECASLKTVTLKSGLKSIGYGAFTGCSALTAIAIPDSVTYIGAYAFIDCSGLTSIAIPDRVTSINIGTFHSCSSLTTITIPDSVTAIGEYAFMYCRKLETVTIGKNVSSIGSAAFIYCNKLKTVTILNKITEFGTDVFKYGILGNDDSNITLYGYESSTTETYAKKCGHSFVALNTPSSEPENPKPNVPNQDTTSDKDSTFGSYLGKKITYVTLNGTYYFDEDKTKLFKDKEKNEFLETLIGVSLKNADENSKSTIESRIKDLLFKATYRPTQFGSTKNTLKAWPVQNDTGGTVCSVSDSGLGYTVEWETSCKGSDAYARFCSVYVFHSEGTAKKEITSTTAQLKTFLRKYADPGEMIYYKVGSGKYETHSIVFLGENLTGDGFYFLSYGGGLSGSKEYHSLDVCYISYSNFKKITNGVAVEIYDTNNGSYYNGGSVPLKNITAKGNVTKIGAPILIGDVSNDGTLNIEDALALFQYSILPDVYPVEYSGDMDFNLDGNVDIDDALLVFQHSMLPDVYPL